MKCLNACWALPKLCTMRSVNLHLEACHWNTSLEHVPAAFSCVCKYCDFVNSTCPVYTSLLNVPATRPNYMSLLHVLATCRLSVYYTRFCRCHMSLQHDPLCLATFIVWNRVPYQVLFAVFAICWSKYLLKYHLFWRYHLFFLSAQL